MYWQLISMKFFFFKCACNTSCVCFKTISKDTNANIADMDPGIDKLMKETEQENVIVPMRSFLCPFSLSFSLNCKRQACLPVPIFAGHTDFGPQSRFPDFMRWCTDFGRCRIFSTCRFRFVFFSPVFPHPFRILNLPPARALCCCYK